MIIKDKKMIKDFLSDGFVNSDKWKNKNEYYDFPNFIITNDKWWDRGFDSSYTVEEKRNFYEIANQALTIIINFAKDGDETKCCIGPFHTSFNFMSWKNLKEFDSYNALRSLMNDRKYLIVDTFGDSNLLSLVVENNFRYFSEVGIYFKKSNVLIEPTHNSELLVFTEDKERYKHIFSKIIANMEWKICGD